MSTGKKIALGILIFFAVILVALVVVVPRLIDVDRYRPEVVQHIQKETGKPAEIGRLTLRLLPSVSIRVDDFTLGNPPGFPHRPLLKVRRVYAVLDARALWDRQIIITSLELDDPEISLLSDVRGRWNFENTSDAHSSRAGASEARPMFTLGIISKVLIAGGRLEVANLLSSGRLGPSFFEARKASSQLTQVDLNAFITSSSASLSPRTRPSTWDSLWPWDTSTVYAATPGSKPAAQGSLEAQFLRFGALQASAVKSKVRLFPKQVFFDNLSFELYGGRATGDLSFNFAGKNPRYAASAHLSGMDVAQLLASFPDARGKMTGRMEGSFKLAGEVTHSPDPLAGMRGTGQISIRNGQLPTLQINKNLFMLAQLSNIGPASGDPSSFSSISGSFNLANQRITSDNLALVGNGVNVDARGSLTMAGEGSLSYEGLAKIAAGQNPISNLLANLSGATFADGKLTFPFTIGGTFQAPKFGLKSAVGGGQLGGIQNVIGGGAQQPGSQPQPADLVQGIVGMIKKKQPQQQQPQQSQPRP